MPNATVRADARTMPEATAPPPMPDLTRDLVGLSMLLAQASISVRKLLVRADADEARAMLNMEASR
jgi:hypothetical protein